MKLKDLYVGKRVWWEDPDEGLSSDYYIVCEMPSEQEIQAIQEEESETWEDGIIIGLKPEDGKGYTETYLHELFEKKT